MAETVSPLVALSNDLAATVDRAGRSIVAVHARHRLPSSGIHWRTGFVVTADHAVKREEEITVTLPDGRTEPASLAARDPATDIAVLRIDGALLSAATIGPDDALQVGHIALAVGRGESGVTASLGVVSALGGPWRTWRGGTIDRFVRLDLTLYPGSSGGALIDVQGRV
ncbi:MAG TPA: trypsin-like peptidase domain-containing protein, partial [Bryobacteraceae bacterium]|nr:trypsin-like peptidase domain-containing protein [Bryobacteraceae bacterium]